jgi:hypothetical protein
MQQYPEVAAREMPWVNMAHPQNARYLFSRKCRDLLRTDPALWPERRKLVWLAVASILLPLGGFSVLAA